MSQKCIQISDSHDPQMVVELREAAHAIGQYSPEDSSTGELLCRAAAAHAKLVRGIDGAIEALVPGHWYPGNCEEWAENQRTTRDWLIELRTKIGGDA